MEELIKKKRVKKVRLRVKVKEATPKSLKLLDYKIHEVLPEISQIQRCCMCEHRCLDKIENE